MKNAFFLMAAAMLFVATACSNSTNNSTSKKADTSDTASTADTMTEGITVLRLTESDKTTMFGLTDLKNEMSADLFRGSYNDNLLDSLLPAGASRSSINVFMVHDSNHTILFDAGLGADKGGQLMNRLKSVQIEPSDITAVCLTHLHPDHIGGLLLNGQAAFPNATLYLSEEESDFNLISGPLATNKLWVAVAEAYKGRIKTLRDGEELFDGLVIAQLAPGHTPGHTVYLVGGRVLVAGDFIHAQDLQINHPQFCARYDNDPKQATATRIRILDSLRKKPLYLAGAHCYKHFIQLGK